MVLRFSIADGGVNGLVALDNGTFDVMIVDIFMPNMRGFESIRIFHERAPTVPLIATSGYAFANLNSPAPDFLRMALEFGASRCLRKPFTPVALLAVINECLSEAKSAFQVSFNSDNQLRPPQGRHRRRRKISRSCFRSLSQPRSRKCRPARCCS
jgi:CheY-like chemotaxis protein